MPPRLIVELKRHISVIAGPPKQTNNVSYLQSGLPQALTTGTSSAESCPKSE
jgi:hypothetical protein